MRKHVIAAAVVGLTASVPGGALADWGASADSIGVGSQAGQVVMWTCPANGVTGTVWGSGLYTSDSSICSAAVHSGHITAEAGGEVAVSILAGAQSYVGSVANNVSSFDYGAWTRSFQVVGAVRNAASGGMAVETIEWSRTLDSFGLESVAGQEFSVSCPAGGRVDLPIWGSAIYSSDSPICIAATHVGLISTAQGGTVTVMTMGPQQSFDATSQNGVTSLSFGAWSQSFAFR